MDDVNNSYSIYIDKRPFRTAYLMSKSKVTFEQVGSIMQYNMRKWGGRYNLILPLIGNDLNNPQWEFLRRYDPDLVNVYFPISRKLAIDLDTKVTPLQVLEKHQDDHFSPRVDNEGISILPAERNIRQVSGAFGEEIYIVLFDVEECEDDVLKSFIENNFGTLDLREMSNRELRSYPYKILFKITNKESFIGAMKSFNDFKPYVFPIQLCSIGDFIGDDRTLDNQDNFYIFVGDSPLDLVDFWNNPLYLQSWTRAALRQMWLPLSMANDEDLLDCLKNLIKGRADPYGNGQKTVVFSSRKMSEEKLALLATKLTDGTWLRKTVKATKKGCFPVYPDYFSFDRIKTDMAHFRGVGKEEKIIISPPEIEEGVMGGEYWMNDLYIQVPEKKVVPVNFETWLQLPKNNSIAHTVTNGIARMTQNGIPSVLTSRSTRFNVNSREFVVKLPITRDTFASMIMNTGKPCFTNDARSKYIKPYQHTIKTSAAGKHIHGFLEVFGSLEGAYQVFEKSHWRDWFDYMANVNQEKEEKRINLIMSRLKKQVPRIVNDTSNFTGDEFIEWLAEEVQKTAKLYTAASPKAVPFGSLVKIVKKQLADFNSINPHNKFRYNRVATVEALNWLTETGAVMVGYELTCPSCLNKEWRALNEVDQVNACRGCGYESPFTPETEMKYKLNTAIENGIRIRGVTPVILALGTLFRDARHYFDFLPPVDIYKKGKHITDLDICCVIDGKFIIGEVKMKQALFKPSDFATIAKLAKEIHPDKVVFTSMDKVIPQKRKVDVENTKKELEPYSIEVEWLYLDSWVYEASPIY